MGDLNICLYPDSPLSCPYTCERGGCNKCLVFPLSCPSSYRNARKKWFGPLSVPGFLCHVFLLMAR